MIYYRVALRGSQSAAWRWKSSPLTSLDGVLGMLKLYHCMPREHIRVFLYIFRAAGDDAQAGKSGIALHRLHCRSTLGQVSRQLDRGEAPGVRTGCSGRS
jgi:hypothetical protein